MAEKIVKTDEQWREQLTEEQFHVTRKLATERAFTGAYWDCKKDGVYECVCCGQPLFDAQTKFDSGTGWPSFWQPLAAESVGLKEDRGGWMVRTEVVCPRCDAHLGHVFDDGPPPTGLRWLSSGNHYLQGKTDSKTRIAQLLKVNYATGEGSPFYDAARMESAFAALPGMGRLTVEAILYRDYPIVQTNVMLVACTLVTLNLLVDLTYAWLDPRIRYR